MKRTDQRTWSTVEMLSHLKIVYITYHGLMLPIMVEIPGGRIIYPNGITANGVHDPIPF